jgi:hypothetical protein
MLENGGLLIQTCYKVLRIHTSWNPLDERGEIPKRTDFVTLGLFMNTWRTLDPRDQETTMACWLKALKRPIDVGERDQRLIG